MSTSITDTIVGIAVIAIFWVSVWLIVIARQSIRYVYLISYDRTYVTEGKNGKPKFEHVTKCEVVTLCHRINEENIRAFRFAHGGNNVNHCDIIAITKIRIKFQRDAH